MNQAYNIVMVGAGCALLGDGNLVTCNISWFRFIKKISSYAPLPTFCYIYTYTEIYVWPASHPFTKIITKKRGNFFEELHKKILLPKKEQRDNKKNRKLPITIEAFLFSLLEHYITYGSSFSFIYFLFAILYFYWSNL